MKHAVVSSSQVFASGRMDAGFHVAYAEVKHRVSRVAAAMSADEARDVVARLELSDLEALRPLARGQVASWNRDTVDRIMEEYPLVAMAMLQDGFEASIRKKALSRLADSQAYVDLVNSVAERLADDPDLPSAAAPSPR